MSKITNLIGTTWRLDGLQMATVPEGYGIFAVNMVGTVTLIYNDEGNGSDINVTTIGCGYYDSETPESGVCYVIVLEDIEGLGHQLPISGESYYNWVYELTITGGDDISNPLFIDFINTYGTLVSGGEPPTAEGVKSKLQSLITASNAKTGKTDANLTDAVKTLLEGYGKGGGTGGGGECSGKHIIEVDTLPEVGEEGKIYAVKAFTNAVIVMSAYNLVLPVSEDGNFNGVITTSEEFPSIEPVDMMVCYVTDIPEIYIYEGDMWQALSTMGGDFLGEIESIDKADPSKDGFYAVLSNVLYQYTNGQYKRFITKGGLIFSSNGDGTCAVDGVQLYPDENIIIPSVSPDGDTVTSIDYSAFTDTFVRSVKIPDTVTEYGSGAFKHCVTLEKVVMPNKSVIANSCFLDCYSLTDVTLSNVSEFIRDSMFENCISLKSIFLPASVRFLQPNAFKGCINLTTIEYGGTTDEWQSRISYYDDWNSGVPATKVICSNGEVNINRIIFRLYTVGSTIEQAEEGMTWADWVKSGFNKSFNNKLTNSGDDSLLYTADGRYLVSYDDSAPVYGRDIIVANKSYSLVSANGGGGSN